MSKLVIAIFVGALLALAYDSAYPTSAQPQAVSILLNLSAHQVRGE